MGRAAVDRAAHSDFSIPQRACVPRGVFIPGIGKALDADGSWSIRAERAAGETGERLAKFAHVLATAG